MSKIDKAFEKLGSKTIVLAEAIQKFDYRYILLAAIFGLGLVVGAILF